MTIQIELTSLNAERREALEQGLERTYKEAARLEEQWQADSSCLLPPPERLPDARAERDSTISILRGLKLRHEVCLHFCSGGLYLKT